jgi:FkbM family methyltransferase
MKIRDFRRPFLVLLRILTIGVALLMIPFIVLVSTLLAWNGIATFLVVILPSSLLVLWLVSAILRGGLRWRESPVRFIAVVTVSALCWLVVGDAAANVFFIKSNAYLAKMNPSKWVALTTGIVNDVASIEAQNKGGLFSNEHQQRQIYADYARFYLSVLYPFLRNQDDIRILDYHVRGYDYYDTGTLFQEIFIDQQYFFRAATPSPRIIDSGSHIGLSILYFKALYPQASVPGFEPAPTTYKFLSENMKNNRLRDVRLEKKAVSNEEGKLEFFGDMSKTSSLIKERGSRESEMVDVVKLSKYIDREVSFLKLDVEGAEDRVLQDLAAADKLKMIQQMVIEYHHHIIHQEDRLSAFLKILEDHHFGYQTKPAGSRPIAPWNMKTS